MYYTSSTQSHNSSSKSYAGAIVAACIFIVIGFIIFGLANRAPDQYESDCSKVETYDAQSKRCKAITGLEYAKKWAKSDEANYAYGKEHATVCTPASEITRSHIGKYILACFTVESIYDTGRGTVFLNSAKRRGDFSVVSFKYNPLKYSDAKNYLGKYIGVYGNVVSYNGELEIIIDLKEQITLKPRDYFEGYTKSELERERSSCFEKEIRNAKTKEAKDKIMSKCRVLSLKGLLDEEDFSYGY